MSYPAALVYQSAMTAAAAAADGTCTAPHVIIRTSASGHMKLTNCAARLRAFAETVRTNWAAFGGGPKPAELKPARRTIGAAWSATAVQVWREQIEIGQHADAARMALEKLGGRFYAGTRGPLAFVAPKPVEGFPAEFASMRRDDGKWLVMDLVSGQAIGGRGHLTRAAAETDARHQWRMRSAEQQATALRLARRDNKGTQAAALAAWCEAYAVDPAELPPALADVVPMAEPAPELAPVATEAAPIEAARVVENLPAPDAGMVGLILHNVTVPPMGRDALTRAELLAEAERLDSGSSRMLEENRGTPAERQCAKTRADYAEVARRLRAMAGPVPPVVDPKPRRAACPDMAGPVYRVHCRTAEIAASLTGAGPLVRGQRMPSGPDELRELRYLAPWRTAAAAALRARVAESVRAARAGARAADPAEPVATPCSGIGAPVSGGLAVASARAADSAAAAAPRCSGNAAGDGEFMRRVNMAAAYIGAGRKTSRAFDSCFEMWDGDAVCTALMRRAEKRPDTGLARNLWRYLARSTCEAAAARQPAGLTLAEWSRALIAEHEPKPEPEPAAPAPAAAPAAHPRMADALAILTAAVAPALPPAVAANPPAAPIAAMQAAPAPTDGAEASARRMGAQHWREGLAMMREGDALRIFGRAGWLAYCEGFDAAEAGSLPPTPAPPEPSPRRILAAFLPGLAMRSPGTGSRLAGRALPAAHQSGPAGQILARLRPSGADALPPGVVASVHSVGAAGPGSARLPQFARGAPPPGVVAFEIQPGKPERPALQARPHRHTAWLRHPAGEWRRFAPGVAGAVALAGVHGASLRRSILALTAGQPAMPHAGAAGGPAARGRPIWRAAHPPPVMAAVHHLQAAGPMLARSRPLVAGAGPPGVAEMPAHPHPPVWP